MDDDDLFCLYCQKQYQRVTPFLRHVRKEHPGVYENLKESGRYDRWIGDIECENPF